MSNIQTIDFHVDILASLLWQHNEADRLRALVQGKQDWYDGNYENFWSDWVRDVFDLRTANAFGLQVWSILLGVSLVIILPPTGTSKANWGFGAFNKNFNHGNFGQIGSASSGLTVEQARLLLRLRYFQLISRCTIPEINRFMAVVFKDYGKVYALDDNLMHIRYVFTFYPPPALLTLLENYDILPRPAGVQLDYIIVQRPVFGFGPYNKNFSHGTFAN